MAVIDVHQLLASFTMGIMAKRERERKKQLAKSNSSEPTCSPQAACITHLIGRLSVCPIRSRSIFAQIQWLCHLKQSTCIKVELRLSCALVVNKSCNPRSPLQHSPSSAVVPIAAAAPVSAAVGLSQCHHLPADCSERRFVNESCSTATFIH